jgi:hypothetical protein
VKTVAAKVNGPLIFQLRPLANSQGAAALDRSAFRRAAPKPVAAATVVASADVARQLSAAKTSLGDVLLRLRSGGALSSVSTAAPAGVATVKNGSFTINGVATNVNVATDSLASVVSRINSSGADVTASFDANEKKLILTSNSANAVVIGSDTSGFVDAARRGLFKDVIVTGGSLTPLNEALANIHGGEVRDQLVSAMEGALASVDAQAKGLSLVKKNGEATVAVDEARLAETLTSSPDALDALFSATGAVAEGLSTAVEDNDRSDVERVKPSRVKPTPALRLDGASTSTIDRAFDEVSIRLAVALPTPQIRADGARGEEGTTGEGNASGTAAPSLSTGLLAAARRAYRVDASSILDGATEPQFRLIR